MRNLIARPKTWGIYVEKVVVVDGNTRSVIREDVPHLQALITAPIDPARTINSILVQGVSRTQRTGATRFTVHENIMFSADIIYPHAAAARAAVNICFRDTDPKTPFSYVMNADGLGLFFQGLRSGAIQNGPQGFTGRFTFEKKGTELFVAPVL